MVAEMASEESNDEKVNIIIPYVKTFLLPYMSAIRPKGMRKAAEVNGYTVTIQPSKTALIENSLPMVGRAMFIEDPIKAVRNADMVLTNRTVFLLT